MTDLADIGAAYVRTQDEWVEHAEDRIEAKFGCKPEELWGLDGIDPDVDGALVEMQSDAVPFIETQFRVPVAIRDYSGRITNRHWLQMDLVQMQSHPKSIATYRIKVIN